MLYYFKNVISLLFATLFISCTHTVEKDNYPKDKTVSNSIGEPKDSLTFYFPTTIQQGSRLIKIEADTFKLNWYSSALYSTKEPILFNYYLGHNIYRFLWLRSFHRPVIFSLHKSEDKVWLTTKILNKQPAFMNMSFSTFVTPSITLNDYPNDNKELPIDSFIKADRKATIVFNKTKLLTDKEWTEFENLLNNYSFWETEPFTENIGLDGSEWLIEGHLNNNYWFVNRWSPEDDFKKAGEYLINKSEIKEEIY